MTASRIRVILRWTHIAIGLFLLCYIYSPFGRHVAFRTLIRWIAVPVVVLTGLWLWKFPQFNRFFRIK